LVTLAEDDGSSEEGGAQRHNPHADEEEPEASTLLKAYIWRSFGSPLEFSSVKIGSVCASSGF